MRQSYTRGELRESEADSDPLRLFTGWLQDASGAGLEEPHAMTLATVSGDGTPSARVVLLKGCDERGFVFYTNYRSRKARELDRNPRAALVFYWPELERQVRVAGTVERTTREETEVYFATRPRGSQLGAWASEQSIVVSGREELDMRLRLCLQRFDGRDIPAPPHWGGFRLRPSSIEFWQGRQDRMHDRLLYTRTDDGWRRQRLAP